MLYLEDYLEMIEHLPIELRDRFTEMREIDLGIENTVDRFGGKNVTVRILIVLVYCAGSSENILCWDFSHEHH
jgi:hypothetical protein